MEHLVTKAVDVLSNENLIVGKYINTSEGTKPTEQAWAFSLLMLKSENPTNEMTKLARTGSYYGLIGLFKLDKTKYLKERNCFRAASEIIIQKGDFFQEMNPEEFLLDYMGRRGNSLADSLLFRELPNWVETSRVKWPYRSAFSEEREEVNPPSQP